MKGIWISIGLACSIFALSAAQADQAHRRGEYSCRLDCRGGGDGGGSVPSPFDEINIHVQLANGELYLLEGQVVFAGDIFGGSDLRPYFEVDLRRHPWLASRNGTEQPLYPLKGPNSFWRRYADRPIELTVMAIGQVVKDQTGRGQYVISLDPVTTN